ncbi:uncharacterized protein LOC144449131 [Glandiceps talaboti]
MRTCTVVIISLTLVINASISVHVTNALVPDIYNVTEDVSNGISVVSIVYRESLAVQRKAESESGEMADDIVVRQVSDGKHLVTAVFDGYMNIKNCHITRNSEKITQFSDSFGVAVNTGVTNPDSIDIDTAKLIVNQQKTIIDKAQLYAVETDKQSAERKFTEFSNIRQLPEEFSAMLDMFTLQQQCLELRNEKQIARKNNYGSSRKTVVSKVREKRSFDAFSVPGTLWCGPGDIAENNDDLGVNKAADECCREHDSCPDYIVGFGLKYGFINMRPFTISRCDCDNRFKTCLRNANTTTALEVGNLFYNVFHIPCFQLTNRAVEVCARRSWWGRCIERETILVEKAVLVEERF